MHAVKESVDAALTEEAETRQDRLFETLRFRWLRFVKEERGEQEKHLEEGQRGGLM